MLPTFLREYIEQVKQGTCTITDLVKCATACGYDVSSINYHGEGHDLSVTLCRDSETETDSHGFPVVEWVTV